MNTGHAEAQLILQKSVLQHTVAPGAGVVGSIEVTNSTNKPLGVKLYWQDFIYQPPYDKGGKDFMPSGTSDYTCADMVTFSPSTLTLPPFGKDEVKYSVKAPGDFKSGCDGVLFFEMNPDVKKARIGMSFVTRMGALFFLESTEADKSAGIGGLAFNQGTMRGEFQNIGNVVLFPKGVYYILNDAGMVVDRGELKKQYVPPQARTNFDLPVPDILKPGTYTVVLTFDLDQGDSVVKEADFSKTSSGEFKLLTTRD